MTTGAVVKRDPNTIAVDDKGIRITTIEQAYEFAATVLKSGLAPSSFNSAEKIMIAVQSGMELGFSPMRALSAVVVVKGKPSLYGEAALALIHDRKVCSRPPVLGVRGTGDDRVGFCRFQRNDMPESVETTFSVADAKKAQLWNKADSAWATYPEDMLQWRALARAVKRYFGDVTLGLVVAEEARDYPAEAAPRSLNPPAEPDPLLSGAIDAELVDETEPLAPPPKQAGKPPQSLAERAEAAQAFLRAAKSSDSLEKRWTNAKPLCDELRDPVAQVDPHLYADLKKVYDECTAKFRPKGDPEEAQINRRIASTKDEPPEGAMSIEYAKDLANRVEAHLLAENDGSKSKAELALSELTAGKVQTFVALSLYVFDHNELAGKLIAAMEDA